MNEPNNENNAPYIDRGEPLPQSYGENRIVGMVLDPERIYLYWDVESDVRVAAPPLVVRLHNLSEGRSDDLAVAVDAGSWYVQVGSNRTYRAELFAAPRGGAWRLLAVSGEMTTPVRWAGEAGAETPAEVMHAQRHPLVRERPKTPGPTHVAPPGPPPGPPPAAAPAATPLISGRDYVRSDAE